MTETKPPGLVLAPNGVSLEDLRIIKLTGPSSPQRAQRIERADIAIDHQGRVIKDRYGYANRVASDAELKMAVDG